MAPFASGILGHVGNLWGETERDLIVITLVRPPESVIRENKDLWKDQRNHGTLLKDKIGNLSFDKNPRHL